MGELSIGGRKRKFLFLLSDAPGFCEFFPTVGAELERQGHEVIYASDSTHVTYLAKHFHPSIDVINFFEVSLSGTHGSVSVNRGALADWERVSYYYRISSDISQHFLLNVRRGKAFPEVVWRTQRFDVVVSEAPSGIYTTAFFDFCKMNGIAWVGFQSSRISGYWEFPESDICFPVDVDGLDTAVERYLRTISGAEIATPSYMDGKALGSLVNASLRARFSTSSKIREYGLMIRSTLLGKRNFFGVRPVYKYVRHFQMILHRKAARLWPFVSSHRGLNLASDDRTIFFPLHFHPEASTSMLSPEFLSEADLLFYLATHVAADVRILVKEHPSMAGLRRRSEVKAIASLPNVVFLPSSTSTIDLIDRCDLCLTLTSTAGFEALMRGRAVISLGEVFFNRHRNCRVAQTKHDALSRIVNFFNNSWSADVHELETYNRAFLTDHLSRALKFDMNFYEVESFEGRASLLATELSRATIGVNIA